LPKTQIDTYIVLDTLSFLLQFFRHSTVSLLLWQSGDEVQGAPRPVSSKVAQPALSQLFDILPIQGVLPPGQTEQVEFSFYAYPGVKANAVAACQVVDGPIYQVSSRVCGLMCMQGCGLQSSCLAQRVAQASLSCVSLLSLFLPIST
jgi:hypothetical protein